MRHWWLHHRTIYNMIFNHLNTVGRKTDKNWHIKISQRSHSKKYIYRHTLHAQLQTNKTNNQIWGTKKWQTEQMYVNNIASHQCNITDTRVANNKVFWHKFTLTLKIYYFKTIKFCTEYTLTETPCILTKTNIE